MDRATVTQLIDFLTRQPGEADLSEAGGIESAAEIRINDLSGATIETMTFGSDADGTIAIESGAITLRYTAVNLPDLLPRAGHAAATRSTAPITSGDYNK